MGSTCLHLAKDKNTGEDGGKSLRRVIQTAITSMISVPKPLKFLHHTTLKAYYKTMTDLDLKKLLLADILSVLAFTLSAAGEWVHYAKGI
ncbi:hypothetical protein LguiA_012856 [Lonicera macranthoides]